VAAPPPVAPTQAPPRSRHPRKRQPRPGRRRTESPRRPQWRRLHQPRPRRPRRVAAAPVRDAATRRRPPARQRAPGVADSDRSQSQDGPLASGPKVLGSSVCEGLLGRARRRTESLVETCGEGGSRPHLYRARRRTESLVETCGEGGSRPRWAAPDVAPSPLWTRAMKGAAAGACSGLVLLLHIGLSRTNAVPSPQWKRASEGTTVGLGRYRAVPIPQWKRASEGTTGGLGRSNAVPNPTWKQASEGTTSRLRSSGPVRRCLGSPVDASQRRDSRRDLVGVVGRQLPQAPMRTFCSSHLLLVSVCAIFARFGPKSTTASGRLRATSVARRKIRMLPLAPQHIRPKRQEPHPKGTY
jgi:hypothetical protein